MSEFILTEDVIIDWSGLFEKYDLDKSGAIDNDEFAFLVKDLMNVKSGTTEAPSNAAIQLATRFRRKMMNLGLIIRSNSITQEQLKNSYYNSVFEGEFDGNMFSCLCSPVDLSVLPPVQVLTNNSHLTNHMNM